MNQKQLEYQTQFWGDCINTYKEEEKHFVYGKLMGLQQSGDRFIIPNIRILDIGGGPVSLLLKCEGLSKGRVLDPIDFPDWTKDRYKSRGIDVTVGTGEDHVFEGYDEVWIYNTLGFVDDPSKLVENAFKSANTVRVFEWITLDKDKVRNQFSEDELNELFAITESDNGRVVDLKQKGCHGTAYYGVFKGLGK